MTFVTLIGASLGIAAAATAGGPPAAEKKPVIDTYHGAKVIDDYRWLEDGDDAAVREWSDTQNAHARDILDKLPNVDAIRARVTEILGAKKVSYGKPSYRNGRIFAIKRQPPKQQPFLIVMTSADDTGTARVLVDPNTIDTSGGTSIDWYIPSPDGNLVAVSLSKGGSESGDVYVYETASGRLVHEVIPRVNGGTAGGDVAWAPNGSGFYYTRYPRTDERPEEDMAFYQQVYFHKLGTPTEKDRYEIGKELPRIAEIQLDVDNQSGRVLATVQYGDSGEFAHYLRTPNGKWRQFSRFGDKIVQAAFAPNDSMILVSRRNAPRGEILRVHIAALDVTKAETIVPQGQDTIVTEFHGAPTVLPTDSRLYVEYQLGGPSEIRVFSYDGSPLAAPRQLPVSAVYGLTHITGDDVLFGNTSFIAPAARYFFDAKTGKTKRTALVSETIVNFDDVRVTREFATSKDGTKIPVNIIMPKTAKLDGSNRCLVTGYGGYNVSLDPYFSSSRRILLDQGVIYAVANLRGGGEYGEQWHRQGNLTNKQNVFDDFKAVLQHMIERGYTSPDKLAIMGGSNGGLLMGAALTQYPELFHTVLSFVGVYDMLRVELSANGAFNIPEYGTVTNPEHFKALHAYSPYHNVKDGVKFPATLFMTGANDPRVDPMQSRKMTARMQAATASNEPILLRTSSDSGHGGGTPLAEQIAESTSMYAFLFAQLGVEFRSGSGK
ncbi:MAG: S9 family peptidase [Phycisphaerales bacterium]|nr:MAG: S9 family peptidase [Phycisphaerales bacterium]